MYVGKVTVKDSNNLSYLTGSPECDGSSPVLQTMTASTPKLMDEGIQVSNVSHRDKSIIYVELYLILPIECELGNYFYPLLLQLSTFG